jgi:ribonuclease G
LTRLVARASAEVIDWLERGNPYLVERLRRKVTVDVKLVGEGGFPRERIDVGAVQ